MMKLKLIASLVVVALLGACTEGAGGSAAAGGSAEVHPGEQTYTRFCFSCHAAGIAGAPRTGSVEQWAPRIAKGADALLRTTIDGIPPGMPARGLCNQCSDQELADAVDFMVSKSR